MISEYILTNRDYILEILLGFVLIFAGNTLVNLFEKKKKVSAFVRFLLCTGFAYSFTVVRNTVEFFVDYYSETTCLQKFNGVPAENLFFFKLFGTGYGGTDQYPVLDTDFTFLSFMLGCAVGGGILWLYYSGKQEKRFHSDYKKQSLKSYIKSEINALKSGVHLWEYILWWVVRLGMVVMIIRNKFFAEREPIVITMLCVNFSMTFIIPLVRFLFFKKIFFGNLPFRVQSFIDIFVFTGSFLGHGFDFAGKVSEYDKVEHIASGVLTLIIGYIILKSLQEEHLSTATLVIGSSGFAGVVMIVWEVFEFFSDFYIDGSRNQNWFFSPNDTMLFIRIFGYGAGKTAQYPLLDTQIDIFYAFFGMIIGLPFLCLWIYGTNRAGENAEKKSLTKNGVKQTVTN